MAEKKTATKRTSRAKQEVLEEYGELAKELEEKRDAEMAPEEKIAVKAAKKVVETADAVSAEGIISEIGKLKGEVGRVLATLSERLEGEVNKYEAIKKAVEIKEKELQEIYEIQKSASSLVALTELQAKKKEEFEAEMEAKKEALGTEIETIRSSWEEEKRRQNQEIKERDAAEVKRRERERGEYEYAFNREQQLAREQFEDEKARLEREMKERKETAEKELAVREQALSQSESELKALREKAAGFPKELEVTVAREVKIAVEKVQTEARNKEELLKKEIEGEKNVLLTKIAAFETKVKEQADQLAKLTQQFEKAYEQVQSIAIKAVEGSIGSRQAASFQHQSVEQGRGQEK